MRAEKGQKWKNLLKISKNGFFKTDLRFSLPTPKFYDTHRNYEILSKSMVPGGEGGEQLLVELVLQPLLGRLHRLQGGAQLVQGTVLRLMVPEHNETANQQSRKENP